MATILKIKLVGLTAGLVKPRMLTEKGSKRNAPETPPIEVKKETQKATSGGTNGDTSTPDSGKIMIFSLFV
jgi:hypothetical protein